MQALNDLDASAGLTIWSNGLVLTSEKKHGIRRNSIKFSYKNESFAELKAGRDKKGYKNGCVRDIK